MTGSIRIFEKLNFTPKLSALAILKVKLPNMTDWHILPGLKIDVLIACCRLPVSPRKPSVAQGQGTLGFLTLSNTRFSAHYR